MQKTRRTPTLTVLALAALLQLGGCSQGTTPADYVLKANEHVEKGELRSAAIQLANALQQEPNNSEARWLLAQVSLALGDAPKAERDARRAMELGIPQTQARPVLIESIILQGDHDRAIAEATSLPASMPQSEHPVFLALRGKAHVLKGELAEAKAAAEQALAIDPKHGDALVVIGVVHSLRGEYDDARAAIMAAIDVDGDSADAWSSLGELEMALGNASEAEAAFGKAIRHRHYPTLDRARRALARIQLERFDDAEADLRVLVNQGWKDHPYVNHVRGLVHFNRKNYAEAAAAFESAYAVQPEFLPNRVYLALTRLLLGETEQARMHAQWAHANAPHSRTAGQLLGVLSIALSDYAAAREALQAALRTMPDNVVTLSMLTTVSLLTGDTAQGVAYASRVAALEPDSPQAQEALMLARLMAGQQVVAPTDTADAANAGDDQREFLLALEAFRDKRIDEALERAKKLHEQFPERVDPINLMAACHLASGRWDLARIELERVLEIQPNEPSATRNLAKVELQAGNLERASDLLRSLVAALPGDEEAALLLAEAEIHAGNQGSAITVLEQVVANNAAALTARARLAAALLDAGQPARALELTRGLTNAQLQAQPALLEMRGKAEMLSGDPGAARSTFEQWARIAPDSAPARFHYGNSLAMEGNLTRARTELEHAVQLDPKFLPARVGLVKMHVQEGEIARARQALTQLRDEFGGRSEVLGIEGWFALGTGDFATAEQRFRTLLQQGADLELVTLLSRALWAQSKHDEVLELQQAWLRDRPDDTIMHLQIAEAYMALGRDADARTSYETVLALNPEHVPALNNLAWLHRNENPGQALQYAQRAHQLAPEDPHVLDTLGMLLFQQGELTRAHRFVGEAAERAPADAQIQLHLGRILMAQQRLDEARKILDLLVSRVPDSEPGREARTLLESMNR
jgi:putative PEP-CTERM system TPR-repeat lipoprotein